MLVVCRTGEREMCCGRPERLSSCLSRLSSWVSSLSAPRTATLVEPPATTHNITTPTADMRQTRTRSLSAEIMHIYGQARGHALAHQPRMHGDTCMLFSAFMVPHRGHNHVTCTCTEHAPPPSACASAQAYTTRTPFLSASRSSSRHILVPHNAATHGTRTQVQPTRQPVTFGRRALAGRRLHLRRLHLLRRPSPSLTRARSRRCCRWPW